MATVQNPSTAVSHSVPGVGRNNDSELFTILGNHRLRDIADLLGAYLGVGADVVSLLMFLSRAAGRLQVPFNLAIYSDDAGAECLIADRISNVVPEGVHRVETIRQIRDLSEVGFEETELLRVRSLHDGLFRFACESACRDLSSATPPSVWLITDERPEIASIGPTIQLMATQAERELSGFGQHFSLNPDDVNQSARHMLRQIVLSLNNRRHYSCPFVRELRASLKPFQMLIVNRLLATVAALRIELQHQRADRVSESEMAVQLNDYAVTRDLLLSLPIPGEHSGLSPYAAETGAILFDRVSDPEHQLTIPDNSGFGNKAFTRRFAKDATGFSYGTMRDHLARLEAEGIIESLTVSGRQKHAIVRGQGRQIYYRFVKNQVPPFGVNSPFVNLPDPNDIAADYSESLHS
jgi:hypothetical protein